MTENEFWQLVTRDKITQQESELTLQLKQKLSNLTDDELAQFDKLMALKMRQAFTWHLWGAAYVMAKCDTDYAFAEFRCYLISLGKVWFDKIIDNPDLLAEIAAFPLKDNQIHPFLDEFDLLAGQLYEDRTGHELPFIPSGKNTPQGKPFDNRPKVLKKQYPQLWARFMSN